MEIEKHIDMDIMEVSIDVRTEAVHRIVIHVMMTECMMVVSILIHMIIFIQVLVIQR